MIQYLIMLNLLDYTSLFSAFIYLLINNVFVAYQVNHIYRAGIYRVSELINVVSKH